MFPEHTEKQSGAAAMQSAQKHEMVRLRDFPGLSES
jgi:hypothetical protein